MGNDLFDSRLTEQRNRRTAEIDRASAAEIVDLINAEDRRVPEAVYESREDIARAIEIAVTCFRQGGRLIYVGAGTSGRLGVLDATECPPTFGTDPEMVQGIIAGGLPALTRSQEGAEDRAEDGAAAVADADVGPRDFVFGIATSSTTPYVLGALQRAAELGARTGFLCCTEPGEDVRSLVDVCVVPLVGPEPIAGSTRMKAGTATKLVLNMLTTGAMIRLGKVYGNLMVDLKAMSEKLRDRSQRIVMAVTQASREEALALIDAAHGSVKVAIVMKLADVSPELARLYLLEGDGFVRLALSLAETADSASVDHDPYGHYPAGPPTADAVASLMQALGRLPERIAALAESVDDERLSARPSDDRWCAKEHVEHLIAWDEIMAGRLSAILEEQAPALANQDDDATNRGILTSGAREAAFNELLRRLREGREKLVALIEKSSAEDLSRKGRHEAYGPISAYQLLRHVSWHDHRHLQAIRGLIHV